MGSKPATSRAAGQTRLINPRSLSFGNAVRQISQASSRFMLWSVLNRSARRSTALRSSSDFRVLYGPTLASSAAEYSMAFDLIHSSKLGRSICTASNLGGQSRYAHFDHIVFAVTENSVSAVMVFRCVGMPKKR